MFYSSSHFSLQFNITLVQDFIRVNLNILILLLDTSLGTLKKHKVDWWAGNKMRKLISLRTSNNWHRIQSLALITFISIIRCLPKAECNECKWHIKIILGMHIENLIFFNCSHTMNLCLHQSWKVTINALLSWLFFGSFGGPSKSLCYMARQEDCLSQFLKAIKGLMPRCPTIFIRNLFNLIKEKINKIKVCPWNKGIHLSFPMIRT